VSGKNFLILSLSTIQQEIIANASVLTKAIKFFCLTFPHMKVEISKIGLYYTRAIGARQNSGLFLELKKFVRR